MHSPEFHRRRGPRRALASLAPIILAVGACGGSGASVPATGSVVTASASTVPATPTAAARSAAPSTSSSLVGLTLLWQKGGPVTDKVATYWPAIDPKTGNIWVAASRQNQFWIFSPDGKFLEVWGTPGTGPGQFNLTSNDPNPDSVGAIAFAPDGTFFVTDTGNYRVEKFDAQRHFVTAWGSFGTGDGQFGSPKGVATDGKTVYVSDDPRADVQVFDTTGQFLHSFPFPFALFTLAPSGHLFVTDRTGVLELDGQGKQVAHRDLDYTALGGVGAQVAVDAAGHIFVEIQNDSGPVGLVELDAHGAVLKEWADGGETMALSPDGKAVYLAYTGPPDVGWDFIRKYALP